MNHCIRLFLAVSSIAAACERLLRLVSVWICLLFCAAACDSKSQGVPVGADVRPAAREPTRVTVGGDLQQLLDVWQHGWVVIPRHGMGGVEGVAERFVGFDDRVVGFMRWPILRSSIEFAESAAQLPTEVWVEQGLNDPDAMVRARALVVLMYVGVAESVERQRAVLSELSRGGSSEKLAPLIHELENRFAARSIEIALRAVGMQAMLEPSQVRVAQWNCKAASVMQHKGLIPLLALLSTSANSYMSVAAEGSLEGFGGVDADDGLLVCVGGWRYDACERACRVLKLRCPTRLAEVLRAIEPRQHRIVQGLILGDLGDPFCVKILCEEIGSMDTGSVRRALEFIGRLSDREDMSIVEGLPAQVSSELREEAVRVVENVRERLRK